MLELSDPEFKTMIINILRNVVNKVDRMQKQMDNVSREIKILRKSQKEMLDIKKETL